MFALFYKEWIKTRRPVFLMALALVAFIVYALVHTEQLFRVNGHVAIWSAIILKDMSVLPTSVKWFPLLTGLLLGIAQYVPEMRDKRLKLTLHLPMPETKIIFFMLGYGMTVLFVAYVLMCMILSASLSFYYTTEIMQSVLWQLLVYGEGGVACYLFTAWVCIEPVWKQRVVNALAAMSALYLFFMEMESGAYGSFGLFSTILLIVGFCFPFYSAGRFKNGSLE